MPRKRYSTEQIVTKLRQAEVDLGRGLRVPQCTSSNQSGPMWLMCKRDFLLVNRLWRCV